MNYVKRQRLPAVLAAFFVFSFVWVARAATPVTITVDPNSPGSEVSPDFTGLSFETGMLRPIGGKYFFDPDHAELISLFKSLGIKCLRIGGNSADSTDLRVFPQTGLDRLFGFARAAGVHVIYNLRLKGQTDPAADVQIAKYLMDHYKPLITSFTIGNEPNIYFAEYSAYRAQWKHFADAIVNEVPDAKFNGPSTTPGKTAWSRDFASDFATSGHLALVTQHSYPGGNARLVADPAAARTKVLAPAMDASYETFYKAFVPAVIKNHELYRLEEANSLFHGGATGVSNSYASALWALDYVHWWASHGADGINFHTGNHVVDNENQVPGGYDVSYSTPSGLKTHPLAYALKAFTFSSQGHYVAVSVQPTKENLNLTAYAVSAPDRSLILTVINKESGPGSTDADLSINLGGTYAPDQWILIQSPNNDVSRVSGTTLGGAPIAGDGSWNGAWTPIPAGQSTLDLPASTAAVIRFKPQ